jgi:hypothetical protein
MVAEYKSLATIYLHRDSCRRARSGMSLTLCVLLWAREGRERDLTDYEDRVLQLVPDYAGRVLQRARADGSDGGPLEIQFLVFPSEDALDADMSDEQRQALAQDRDVAVARTEVLRVQLL